MPYETTKVHHVQGLTGKIYFVHREEAGDKLYSLYERLRFEVVFEAAGLKIIAVSLDVDNAEGDVEADIVLLDAKGTLYRLHFTRGESKPTHTILEIPISDPEKLLKSC